MPLVTTPPASEAEATDSGAGGEDHFTEDGSLVLRRQKRRRKALVEVVVSEQDQRKKHNGEQRAPYQHSTDGKVGVPRPVENTIICAPLATMPVMESMSCPGESMKYKPFLS